MLFLLSKFGICRIFFYQHNAVRQKNVGNICKIIISSFMLKEHAVMQTEVSDYAKSDYYYVAN